MRLSGQPIIKRYHELPVSELWLVDVEGGKAKLDIIFDLCQRMIDNAGVPMKLYKTLDRREALKDADFVTTITGRFNNGIAEL